MKKIIGVILSVVLTLGLCSACFKNKEDSVFNEYNLQNINYEKIKYDKGAACDDVILTVPAYTVKTGQEVLASCKINAKNILPEGSDSVYFIIDWGDGSLSYIGPGVHSKLKQSYLSQKHDYSKAGVYNISATAVAMQSDKEFGWSAEKSVTVVGEAYTRKDFITRLKPVSSESYGKNYTAKNIADNSAAYFKSSAAADIYQQQYVGYLFDNIYTLDKLEIKLPNTSQTFPSNIAIEFTTDGGKTWQSLPKYYYLYDYSVGRYKPIMNFPNFCGGTLSLKLDGIVANGIRICSKLGCMNMADINKEKCLEVEEMRVYGSMKTLLYTSQDDTFNADLNNMWTIFGTAKTEPIIAGSLKGEQTNSSPFRTGAAMIGSTEWLEWTGLKFNFTNYTEVKDIYFEQLKETRYGSDGWSNDDGYIWATADGQGHLDMGNHYSLNPIFIIAARNYLLQGNAIGEIGDDGQITDFMDITNRQGQTMKSKIDKAMSYMMNTLRGSSGVMTILDPDKNGTTNGMSSNYWDVHKSFGYMSAYENSLFYASQLAYADIYEFLGDNNTAKKYRDYAANTKKSYNELFWDSYKKRFITAVNVDGVRLDFGMTFVNFMALSYGVAESSKAADIYDWLDGTRIINGDTSTGEDIYGKFKYAPRATTLDVSSTGEPYYWYDHGGALKPTPGEFGGYGNQMQNGGTIFYISYYDMIGRINGLGADNGYKRFDNIMQEFHADSLRRNSYTEHGEYVEGVIGEFPESGLVPYTFIDGFMGINTTSKGLNILPNLPSCMQFAGITQYFFGNREYSIKVIKGLKEPIIEKYGDVYYVQLPAEKSYTITLDNRLIENKV